MRRARAATEAGSVLIKRSFSQKKRVALFSHAFPVNYSRERTNSVRSPAPSAVAALIFNEKRLTQFPKPSVNLAHRIEVTVRRSLR